MLSSLMNSVTKLLSLKNFRLNISQLKIYNIVVDEKKTIAFSVVDVKIELILKCLVIAETNKLYINVKCL